MGSVRGSQCSLRTRAPPRPATHGPSSRYGPLLIPSPADAPEAARNGANSGRATSWAKSGSGWRSRKVTVAPAHDTARSRSAACAVSEGPP